MANYRFILADDNRPADGTMTLEGISGSGELFVELGWVPNGGTVSLARAFNLPAEFAPNAGATLDELQQSGTLNIYDLLTHVAVPSATTFDSAAYQSVLNPTTQKFITDRGWYITSTGAGVAPSQVTFMTQEYTATPLLYALSHDDAQVCGEVAYFGVGTDVSASYGLAARTRWSLATTLTDEDDIAEMVFEDGGQIQGDFYNWGEDFRSGLAGRVTVLVGTPLGVDGIAGRCTVLGTTSHTSLGAAVTVLPKIKVYEVFRMEDGTTEVQFEEAVGGTTTLKFLVIRRRPEPTVQLRATRPFADDAGGRHGFWVTYKNLPKGDAKMNYHVY